MAAEKAVQEGIRWHVLPHQDTAKCSAVVVVPSRPSFDSRLCMAAHVHRIPYKYSFSILLGSERVAGLDINPGRSHLNMRNGKRESVQETHWQTWPEMDHAEIDVRDMDHRAWMRQFFKEHKISFQGAYKGPPHYGGEQLRLF